MARDNHILHNRNVGFLKKVKIKELINHNNIYDSFVAFGGTESQRAYLGYNYIARAAGQMGVVVIHNNPSFANGMGVVNRLNHDASYAIQVNANGWNGSFYEPLRGMSVRNILDAIVPQDSNGYNTQQDSSLRSILYDYLEIMNYGYYKHFGIYSNDAYSLSTLYDLTSMPTNQLIASVLNYLPDDVKERLYPRFMRSDVQIDAFNAVRRFANGLSGTIYDINKNSGTATTNIVSAVSNHDIINVYVSNGDINTLEYLATELRELNERNIPFLLVVNGIDISVSPSLSKYFLSEHSMLGYGTGYIVESVSSGVENNIYEIMSNAQDTYVFQTDIASKAELFSQALGTYQRIVTDEGTANTRAPFQFFRSHTSDVHRHEESTYIISVNEIMTLGNGCVLLSSMYDTPVIVENIIM